MVSQNPRALLDASALLAYLQDEPGADDVVDALLKKAAISAVNWAETLSKLAERGQDPDVVTTQLTEQGLLERALIIYPIDGELARDIAKLRIPTRALGLSLGDRACLALALKLNLPALTTDRAWCNLDLDIEIRAIR
ncbi:type II toxin-antitoxin system VapC family toxin [Arthrospira platensis]|jgi:PIN domain nuclease of toxin-antitoxin system|uniref:Ribonuclease VapC n=1 Tax=Limnospira platensis NIES-46 TaxID=1236695 RepID=A0A5M3TDW4_LIMPL|nr:type II toxin-antitoxin system VapC family toxin [Arthrospira platensis]AMW30678.1 twitching motility protein PilT [Arthrospira platensis YZ]KDR55305.1 twitching motility protein PilT [Arthrospira platensis str. Paraca]MBD2669982.1 type II toxin-antitoxin system VapC family toxin [Arthrospira platensis FACHB-439]MBD2710457.1 type II toxin-antitoxin system VapC family toxin [Arthrospira platensis FACHB-835]MDF2207332.1 type II toxin-antitoxin system VapC family toxin [Arthrospira platensis N